MDQDNKNEFEEPGTGKTFESIAELITNLNFVHKKSFSPIPIEEIQTKYNDHEFWYVVKKENDYIITAPYKNGMEELAYVFEKKEDAETWMYIISKASGGQSLKLDVKNDNWRGIDAATAATMGEFKWLAIDHGEAQNLFENYPEVLLTREVEEARKLNPDSEDDDF